MGQPGLRLVCGRNVSRDRVESIPLLFITDWWNSLKEYNGIGALVLYSVVLLCLSGASAWLAVAAVLVVGSLAVAVTGSASRWDWQPALVAAEPWRALSAACVHWSGRHLLLNVAAAGLVALLGAAAGCRSREALAWALAWPLGHLTLLGQPGLLHYGGLSGVLHAGVAVAAVHMLAVGPRRRRAIGVALLCGLAVKVFAEAPWDTALRAVAGWDIPVAPAAHAGGAAAGLLSAILLLPRRDRSAP